MVIMNDDTFEEVATFKLTRTSAYIALCSIFLLLTGFTIAVISFTNLRFFIPGYGKQGSVQEIRNLKMRADSMERVILVNQQYYDKLQRIFSGDSTGSVPRDTNMLKMRPVVNEYQ
jgi:hypothetical protein